MKSSQAAELEKIEIKRKGSMPYPDSPNKLVDEKLVSRNGPGLVTGRSLGQGLSGIPTGRSLGHTQKGGAFQIRPRPTGAADFTSEYNQSSRAMGPHRLKFG